MASLKLRWKVFIEIVMISNTNLSLTYLLAVHSMFIYNQIVLVFLLRYMTYVALTKEKASNRY